MLLSSTEDSALGLSFSWGSLLIVINDYPCISPKKLIQEDTHWQFNAPDPNVAWEEQLSEPGRANVYVAELPIQQAAPLTPYCIADGLTTLPFFWGNCPAIKLKDNHYTVPTSWTIYDFRNYLPFPTSTISTVSIIITSFLRHTRSWHRQQLVNILQVFRY